MQRPQADPGMVEPTATIEQKDLLEREKLNGLSRKTRADLAWREKLSVATLRRLAATTGAWRSGVVNLRPDSWTGSKRVWRARLDRRRGTGEARASSTCPAVGFGLTEDATSHAAHCSARRLLNNSRQIWNKFLQFNRNGNYPYRRSERAMARFLEAV